MQFIQTGTSEASDNVSEANPYRNLNSFIFVQDKANRVCNIAKIAYKSFKTRTSEASESVSVSELSRKCQIFGFAKGYGV